MTDSAIATVFELRAGKRFFLVSRDPKTQCIADEVYFDVADAIEVCDALDWDISAFNPKMVYDLETDEVAKLAARFNVSLGTYPASVFLRQWCVTDELPYKVHTGRELTLMLSGKKPLAAFSIGDGERREDLIPEHAFEPYVACGQLIKREHGLSLSGASQNPLKRTIQATHVLYALPNEEWRIHAYILLWEVADRSGWNEGFERMEGALLGYEDWQNNAHIELRRSYYQYRAKAGQSLPPGSRKANTETVSAEG